MRFSFKKDLAKKISLMLALVIVGGIVFSGCYGRTQPRGWSGATVSGEELFVGTLDGRLVALSQTSGAPLWSATDAGVLGTTQTAIYGTPVVGDQFVYIAGYNGKVYAFLPDTGALRWVYPREGNLGPIVGGLVISQGKLIFCDADGLVYALDATTGDRLWVSGTKGKIWVTPSVSGDTVYVSSFDRKLYALNIADGSERWQYESKEIMMTPPLVDSNTVYVGSFDRYIYALDATTGSLKWQSGVRGGKWFWAKPVIYNGILYAPNLDGKVYIIDATSGQERAATVDLASPISSSPVLAGNKVIFATENGNVYPVDTASFEKGASLIDVKTEIGGITKNAERKIYAPLSAKDNTVYVKTQTTSQDVLFAIDTNTQTVLWGQSLTKE